MPAAQRHGVLDVLVRRAALVKNYGFTRMDPFCSVRVGNIRFMTDVHGNGGKAPVWDQDMQLYVATELACAPSVIRWWPT